MFAVLIDVADDGFRVGAAVSSEVAYGNPAFIFESADDALKRIRLVELDIGVAVTVLDSDDESADRSDSREVSVRLLV